MEREPVLVDFALQGGGSHGAFTWGVLDRLLEETWLDIEGVSGTSAGAMNAAVLADGYAADGREGARKALARYWEQVAEDSRFSPFQRTAWQKMGGSWSLEHTPGFMFMDHVMRMFSPYQYNPTGFNALAPILDKQINFDRVRNSPVKIFVTATNVRTGRPKVFRNAEITPQVLMASACLPMLFQAVEIDGEAYWDGGYSGNPTLAPLVGEIKSDDTILIPVNPLERAGVPRTPSEIFNRLNEVSFNSVAVKELYMMALLRMHASDLVGDTEACEWARMRVHVVRNPVMNKLDFSSKLNAEWDFLQWLMAEGRKAGEVFLEQNGASIGKTSTVNFEALLAEL